MTNYFWTPVRRKTLNWLRLEGHSYAECAAVLGATERSCKWAVSEFGLACRRKRATAEEVAEAEEIIRRYAKPGLGDRELGEILLRHGHRINRTWVSRIRNRLAIPSGFGYGGARRGHNWRRDHGPPARLGSRGRDESTDPAAPGRGSVQAGPGPSPG